MQIIVYGLALAACLLGGSLALSALTGLYSRKRCKPDSRRFKGRGHIQTITRSNDRK